MSAFGASFSPKKKIKFPLNDENVQNVVDREKLAINQINKVIHDNPDEIAGLIIEPIQGEGGDNHFRCEFFRELRSLADQEEFLLIYDEQSFYKSNHNQQNIYIGYHTILNSFEMIF